MQRVELKRLESRLRRIASTARAFRRKAQNGDPFGRMETVSVMTAIETHAKLAREAIHAAR